MLLPEPIFQEIWTWAITLAHVERMSSTFGVERALQHPCGIKMCPKPNMFVSR